MLPVKNNERVEKSYREGLELSGLKKEYQVLMLWLKTYRVKSKVESCIRVNTRKLNEVPVTECLPYIHLTNGLFYTKPSLS